jgi:Xaa-Pro aminopeptidase
LTAIQAKDALMDKGFYIENRRRLAAHMADGDCMLFFSGENVRKTADENYPFFTSRNFLYLAGVRQPQSALLLQNTGGKISERLFALKPDLAREIWTGRRFTDPELVEISGIEQIEDIDNLGRSVDALLSTRPASVLWLCFDALLPERAFDLEREFAQRTRDRHPHVTIKNSYPLVCALRKIKSPAEIEAMRTAMKITEAGIFRMMRAARPGIWEYELEAEFDHELALNGQRRTAFPSIISAGERNFYLHYALMTGRVGEGELILTDVGAAYDEYGTDVSRVFPASGRFSERQAQIYQIAYAANRAIMQQVRPGVPFSMPNRVCREVCFEGLKALGILNDFADIGQYVWHGVTHHVGLDTHDVGGYDEPMTVNMLFTVDAGIYVREWGIGLRIEDNVLVTADGCENLSAEIPATIEDIEQLMASRL